MWQTGAFNFNTFNKMWKEKGIHRMLFCALQFLSLHTELSIIGCLKSKGCKDLYPAVRKRSFQSPQASHAATEEQHVFRKNLFD